MEHWNIQLRIQRVTTTDVPRAKASGLAQTVTGKDRDIVQVLDLTLVADSKEEAYQRAMQHINVSLNERRTSGAPLSLDNLPMRDDEVRPR